MKPFTMIAAIILGAFVLGVGVVAGWTVLVSEAADISDRVRRARCTWVDPLPVVIAGHAFAIAATPSTTLYTGARWISGEEVSGYRAASPRFGFCLPSMPTGPVTVQSVTIALDAARASAERSGLPSVGGPLLEIGEASLFLPDAPAPVGGSTDLVVFGRNADFGWPRMVTEGVDGDGFRIGAVCRDVAEVGWLCDVSVLDARTDLSYRFEQLPVDRAAFDDRPAPPAFFAVAQGMRALVGMLEADAVARR